MKPDALELMTPGAAEVTIYETRAEVESLRFLDWFRFDSLSMKCLSAFVEGRVADCLDLVGMAIELATGLPASDIDVSEALVAFAVLGKLNELRYIDPNFVEASVQTETEEERPENFVVVGLMTTLASRFSVDEIEAMTPEFAILCWQSIHEEIAMDRGAVFYSTEMGYRKKWTNRKQGKYMLIPRPSPYAPTWLRKRVEKVSGKPESFTPRFVFGDVGDVVDGKTGKTLREIGEVKDENEL